MEEPKFRGFDVEDKVWRYGFGWYKQDYTEEYKKQRGISEDRAMLLSHTGNYECVLSSMGYFTGVKDDDYKDIYSGDTVLSALTEDVGEVYYDDIDAVFRVDDSSGSVPTLAYLLEEGLTVVGNRYENHERMKGFK